MTTTLEDGLPETTEEMRQCLHKLTIEQKIHLAHQTLLPYPYFHQIFDSIDECRRINPFREEPECVFVGGETNAGKTTIAKEYVAKYPREDLETRTRIPVIHIRVYSPPSSTTLCKQTLYAISTTTDLRGPTDRHTANLVALLHDVKNEVIIFDEVQEFHHNKRVETSLVLASWIKDLSGLAHVTIVLMGMPKAETLFSLNEQLSRRFPRRIRIQPFKYDTADAQKEFDTLLTDAEFAMPLEYPLHIDSPNIAPRIYYASNGCIGFASDLIRGATIRGLERGDRQLSTDLLSQSFEENIREHFQSKVNPFKRKTLSPEQALELIATEKRKSDDKKKEGKNELV
ncbi:MAG: TniB family NTP-binding protein [Nitrospiraceae bacterium]|nr:TniB family NTP-binding protein [Nitrospiraceae bacterium]